MYKFESFFNKYFIIVRIYKHPVLFSKGFVEITGNEFVSNLEK